MESEAHIPETRVQIDQALLSGGSDLIEQRKNADYLADLRISIDKFGSLNQLSPGVHQPSFLGDQAVTNSSPALSHLSSHVAPMGNKSQSSTILNSVLSNNKMTMCTSTAGSHVDTSAAKLSQKPIVLGLTNVHISDEASATSAYAIPERASSPDELTCDSGMDDLSMAEEDRLRLHAACLEGRLSVYGREAETWLRERAELSSEAASLRKRLEATESSLCEIKEQSDRKIAEALVKSREACESLRLTQEQLAAKTSENEQLSANLAAARHDSMSLKSQLTDIQQSSFAKDQALSSLKEKMSELYADLESFRFAHSQALDNKTDLNAELASLRRSQEWYREQLQLTQAARNRLEEELNSMRKWLQQGGTSTQQLAQENARLETQVLSNEAALAEAKRNLSRQLETIRSDIVEREAVFEKIVAERDALESMCQQKSNKVLEFQTRISSLQADLNEAELEVSGLCSSLDQLKNTLQCVETERDNLRTMVNSLESQLNQQKLLMDQQLAKHKEVCAKLIRLEGSNSELTANLNKALEEKAAIEASLQATYKERATLDACLIQLKDDISRVESNFSSLQCELESKNSELSSVLVIRDELSSDLEVLQATLREKAEQIQEIKTEREQLQNASLSLQAENEGLRDDIKRLQDSIGPACEDAANKARQPLITEIERLSTLSDSLQTELLGLRDQVTNLLVEQERYCTLLTRHQSLQQEYDELKSTHTASVEEANAKQSELCQKLQQIEVSCSQTLLEKSSEIDSLTHRLDEKVKETHVLQSEISAVKTKHQQELTQQAADWAYRLSELESRLHAVDAQRIEVEQQLRAVLEREKDMTFQHQKQMDALRAEVAKLESRLSKANDLELKHRQLLLELETTKGREMGLSDAMEGLKRHTANLESTLSQREADIVELVDRAEKHSIASKEAMKSEESAAIPSVQVQHPVYSAPPVPCSNCQLLSSEIALHSDAVSRVQVEMAKVQAALELAKQELAAQSAKTANEVFARQQALEAKRQALEEIERLNIELAETREKLLEASNMAETARADVESLQALSSANEHSNSSEVQALQSVIQAMTNHLESLKKELAETKQEAWHYQANLSDLQGSLRGLIEQSRLFDSADFPSTSDTDRINVVEVSQLEKLLADRASESLLQSRPLVRVNNYLELLQQEIDSLENQVIQHAAVVRNSVASWR
ncbi:unnamed protein product [Mesocestoides corti]|nr:unnamed protein product [Mesocestoides corti]